MIIKKFVGKTEDEAVEAAKKELGNSVVIMNVKNVKNKGFFGLFKSKQVEVTVALEEEDAIIERTRSTGQLKNTQTGAQTARTINSALSSDKTEPVVPKLTNDNIEKKLDSLQTLLETQFKNANAQYEEQKKNESKVIDDAEKKDVQKDEDNSSENPEDESNKEQDKFIRLIYNTMIDNEVDEKYANQIFDEIEKNKKPNIPMDYLLASIYQKMILKFGKSEGILPSENGPKVVVFLGPTGVGKTTTIAKVASSYSVEEKKKIALLTADTYRIAAAEQLRTYANILEVPFKVIYTGDELKSTIEEYFDYDYIFVDTAGHSHQNEEQLMNMKEMLDAIDGVANKDIFLVLSATTKYKDLIKIAENYKKITDYQLIFTKLDETTAVGCLLNVKLHVDSPIAYVTYGQNVPDDIERFNAQKTVKQLLGGKQ